MQKKWWLVAVLAALAGVGVWINHSIDRGLPEGFAGANGRLELQRLDVATLYGGRVVDIKVHEGDAVAKNALLAKLATDQSHSQLAAARAAHQRAEETVARADAEITARRQQQKVTQMELDNTRYLKNDNLVSVAELQQRQAAHEGAAAAVRAAQAARAEAVAAVAQAQAQIDAADSANNDMQIRAPKAGRVEYRIAEPGNVIGAGSRVMTLVDPGDVSMVLFLPTDTIGKIRVGDEARIVLDGMDAVWPAKVQFIAAQAQFTPKYVETANEREKLMYRIKLHIPTEVAERYSGLLKGGLTGNGYVRLGGQHAWPSQWTVRLPENGAQKGRP